MHAPSNAIRHQNSPTRRRAAVGWLVLFACGALEEMGQVGAQLQADLDRLTEKGIPVDIVYEQGMSVLEGNR